MKGLIKYIALVGLTSVSITSCNLDVVPPTAISSENFWKTDKDAWYALNTSYANLKAMDIGDEMSTDNAHSQKPWEGNFELVQQNGVGVISSYGSYSFKAIRYANTFLENVDLCDLDEDIKIRMKAEARFFRAFAYLDLTQYYGKVAIITTVLAYDAPNLARNSVEEVRAFILSELAEVAEILPESYSGGFLHETGRITSLGALGLRSRAALYFGNYVEAEASAAAVMASGKHSLFRVSSITDAQKQEYDEMDLYVDFDGLGIDKDNFLKGMYSYETLWHGTNAAPTNPEFVITREYTTEINNVDNDRYTFLLSINTSLDGKGTASYAPMQDLISSYWDVDGMTMRDNITVADRQAAYADIWADAVSLNEDEYKEFATSPKLMDYKYMQEFKNRDSRLYVSHLFPFKGWHTSLKGKDLYYKFDPLTIGSNGNESWTGFTYRKMVSTTVLLKDNWFYAAAEDYPTMRYAEVLLIFAEARLMNSGYDGQVRAALNDIRNRCGMPEVPASLGKSEAIDFLRNERRIELAVEGHRYDDVRRYGSAYSQKHLNGPSTAPNGYVVVNKVWDDRLMLMPIPASALDKNKLLKDDQNAGY